MNKQNEKDPRIVGRADDDASIAARELQRRRLGLAASSERAGDWRTDVVAEKADEDDAKRAAAHAHAMTEQAFERGRSDKVSKETKRSAYEAAADVHRRVAEMHERRAGG